MILHILRDALALREAVRAAERRQEDGGGHLGGSTKEPASFKKDLADWGRILGNDALAVLVLWRARQMISRFRLPLGNALLRRMQTVIFGVEIDKRACIGEGVWFVHPVGTVVGGDTKIGARARLMGSNTLGTRVDDGYPEIGEDVIVGAGARVLGPVLIGDGARIGAGAVVLRDVPAGAIAVGVPARIVSMRGAEAHHSPIVT